MKVFFIRLLGTSLIVGFALVGCQSNRAQTSVDTGATVSAAVNATTAAQANLQATVDAAVRATTAATQPTATASTRAATPSPSAAAAKTATSKPPTASPTPPVNTVAMTEQELAALIDQAVQEAVAATTTTTTQTTTSTADGTLTTQEAQALQAAVATSQTEISQALALAQAYYDLYAQISTETLAALQAIETDLNSMAASMATMATSLEQINQTLQQGLTLAQSTITQLQNTANQAKTTAQNAQTKAKSWESQVKAELDKRANTALATKPTNIPADLRGTTQAVSTYIDTVRSAVGDNKISKNELSAISGAGANAVAGLNKLGGAQFSGLATAINGTTQQIARGETQKAKSSLGGLEQSARSLPSGPGVPSRP
ncbi:MAG: hypothetical protein HY327_10305 [Chloroflexi bacterium]|nr:hypothetical protein [Chloroflexota bacterium]